MNTLTQFFNPLLNNSLQDARYEVIENEDLSSCDFSLLTISGSLFSLTTFKNVTFESCVFFGSRLENCNFVNCTFKDCEFKFTTLEHCNFAHTTFNNCMWDLAPLKKNCFENCLFDSKTFYYAKKTNNYNRLVACSSHTDMASVQEGPDFEEFQQVKAGVTLPSLPTEEEEETVLISVAA
ncbi:MAG: hypothetical protein HN576_09710 [Bacteriovoracaceae bacterium]|jgi:uncharacterized protein YjbI with pentapeptide repeats|nr:hypothetical protein [Bacteriovoracaceae bacterium]